MPDSPTNLRPARTVERRVCHLFAQFVSVETDARGNRVERVRTIPRGELATFPLHEAARLDALGALAPPGATAEDIQADLRASYEAYTGARRSINDNWSSF